MRFILLVAAVFTCRSALAQPRVPADCGEWPSKAAWEWTDEERLERRFDQACVEARRSVAGQDDRRDGYCRSSGDVNDFVFGTDTPELFLSWELYDSLLRKVFVSDEKFADLQKQIFRDRAAATDLPLPDRFWERLERVSGDYLALLRAQHAAAAKLEHASPGERRSVLGDIERSQAANCAARHAALDAAQAEFGSMFNQLLYIAVPPGVCSSGRGDRASLSWVSRGCDAR